MSTKVRFRGTLEGSLGAEAIARELGADIVDDDAEADLVVLRPDDLDELLEDVAAAAAYERTRDQEFLSIDMVDRLLAGENRVRVWREHRGLTVQALADVAGPSKGYLSDIETGKRDGTVATMKKIAAALEVELDDIA